MDILLEYFYSDNNNWEAYPDDLVVVLKKYSTETILRNIERKNYYGQVVTKGNIPQFSNPKMVDDVIHAIRLDVDTYTYKKIGEIINPDGTDKAKSKYGENHTKLAIQMGLVKSDLSGPTALGFLYETMDAYTKELLLPKLYLRIPIISHILIASVHRKVNIKEELNFILAKSTAERRYSNVKYILNTVINSSADETRKIFLKNIEF